MREFQPAQEPVSATIGPSVTNQSDFRAQADRNGAKPEVPANGQGASPGRPAWAALLEPGVTNAPVAPPSGLAAAPFPGLGKTQAGNLLASLASQSAVPGATAAAGSTTAVVPLLRPELAVTGLARG